MSKQQVFGLILIVLCIDQCTKIYIKTHFELGEEVFVFQWFRILFVENNGMAWGTKISDFFLFISEKSAKLTLTLFRVLALIGIGYWQWKLIKKEASLKYIIAVALIFSGALGNIIDSVFYGLIFDDSIGQKATLFANEGYADLCYGNVVDMLYFPFFKGSFPDWIPLIRGKYFSFFKPVFNVADVAISSGVGLLLLVNRQRQKKLLATMQTHNKDLV